MTNMFQNLENFELEVEFNHYVTNSGTSENLVSLFFFLFEKLREINVSRLRNYTASLFHEIFSK